VAHRLSPGITEEFSPPTLRRHSNFLLRHLVADKSPVNIQRTVEGKVRTHLLVPMMKGHELIGALTISRRRIEHFAEKEIELVADFAAEASIALEIIRRERQLREVQAELAHANRVATLGQVTASITHELKQPMAAARTCAGAALWWLNKTPPDLTETRDALARVVEATDRVNAIVDRIGALMRKTPPRKEAFDLNEGILEVIALTHSEAIERHVTVRTRLAPGLPTVRGDRVQLQQVVLNLIVNAIQAMSGVTEDRRALLISSETIESDVHVSVRDAGPGLRRESLQRLFEPFYTTKAGGMGMGLSICRSIVQAHGGRLWATAHASQGALFQFTIPVW
jgi:C4-dicarboxylate-specific signal transduction histidine kinase